MSHSLSRALALGCLLCHTLPAQVVPGHAVVLWKPLGTPSPSGLRLVDPAGNPTDLQPLDPETIGTGGRDGARAALVTSTGDLYVGLGVDNRSSATTRPLRLRRLFVTGTTVAGDLPFTTLMTVPAGQLWHVCDMKERPDGSFLVGATQTLEGPNPMPSKAVFLVSQQGAVTALSTASFPVGHLVGVAHAGDRYVAAFLQNSTLDVEIVSIPYSPSGPAAFRVHLFPNTAFFGGMDLDVDGTIIVGLPISSTSFISPLARLPHAPNATPIVIANLVGSVQACDVLPAPSLVAWFRPAPMTTIVFNLADTLAATNVQWGILGREPIDTSVRDNPVSYGPASAATASIPWLGSMGGLPTSGNGGFALRFGGTPNAAGVMLAGAGRGSVPTPFGTFLLDASRPLLVFATVVLPPSGNNSLSLPIPSSASLVGVTVDLQNILFSSLSPLRTEMSPGLEITIQ